VSDDLPFGLSNPQVFRLVVDVVGYKRILRDPPVAQERLDRRAEVARVGSDLQHGGPAARFIRPDERPHAGAMETVRA
jgi:hypothetical protein